MNITSAAMLPAFTKVCPIDLQRNLKGCGKKAVGRLHKLGQNISWSTKKVVAYAAAMKNDSIIIVSLIRFGGYMFTGYKMARGLPTGLYSSSSFTQASDMIETVQILSDIDYFYNRKYKQDSNLLVSSYLTLFFTDIFGLFLWLDELTVIRLADITKNFGNIPILKYITPLSFVTAIKCTYTLGYALMGCHSIPILIHKATPIQKRQALLDLISCIAEVAFGIFLLSGAASAPLYIGLGVTAALLGYVSFLHKTEFSSSSA
jgi:hypothetical protein